MTPSGDSKKDGQTEEKMEVDGAGDKPPESRQSLKDALHKMAAERDFLGFTPLLRACQVRLLV